MNIHAGRKVITEISATSSESVVFYINEILQNDIKKVYFSFFD